MANSHSDFRVNPYKVLRLVLVLVGVLLLVFLERRSRKYYTTIAVSCPHCSCECDPEPIISFSSEVIDSSFAGCGKDDPEVSDEMKKDILALLKEEINLHGNVTIESLKRTNALIMDTKKISSHYQKEAEKCNAGVETCEEARERAQVALSEEHKLTDVWKSRAYEYGWKDEVSINLL